MEVLPSLGMKEGLIQQALILKEQIDKISNGNEKPYILDPPRFLFEEKRQYRVPPTETFDWVGKYAPGSCPPNEDVAQFIPSIPTSSITNFVIRAAASI